MSERVLAFARASFERLIAELLDDPSDLETDHIMPPRAAIAEYRLLAADLHLDFDALVAKGHPFEIARLQALEGGR